MTRRPRARRTRENRRRPRFWVREPSPSRLRRRSIARARSGRSTGRDDGASSYRASRRVARSTGRLSTSPSDRNPRKPKRARADRPPSIPGVPDDLVRSFTHLRIARPKTSTSEKTKWLPFRAQAASPPRRGARPRAAPLPAASTRTARTPPRRPGSLPRRKRSAKARSPRARARARRMTKDRRMRPKIFGLQKMMGRTAARAGVSVREPYATAAATTGLTPRTVIRLAAAAATRRAVAASLARTSPASPRRIWIRSRKPSRARARERMRWRAS